MTRMSLPLPGNGSSMDAPVPNSLWLTLWRTVCLDLPLAWAGEVNRFLFR
jgi:hypothetical protein